MRMPQQCLLCSLAVMGNAEPTLLVDLFGMGQPIWAIGRPVSRAWGSPVKLKEHPHRPPRATHRRRGRSASLSSTRMSVWCEAWSHRVDLGHVEAHQGVEHDLINDVVPVEK